MVGAVDVLDEVEALDRGAVLRVVRQTAEEARHRQADVARILGLAERLPLGVFDGVEHLGQITRLAQVGERLQPEQLRRGRGDERCVRGRGDVRHLFDEVDVFGLARDFIVADQRAERCAAEGAELFLVDLLEQRALVEIDRGLEVAHQVALGRIQRLDLDHRAGLRFLDQVRHAAPGAFQLLEFRCVHHGAQLRRDQAVQLGHAGIERRRQVVRHHHGAVQHFLDQLADDVLGTRVFGVGLGNTALLDDLVEQAGIGNGRRLRGDCGLRLRHPDHPSVPCRHGRAAAASRYWSALR